MYKNMSELLDSGFRSSNMQMESHIWNGDVKHSRTQREGVFREHNPSWLIGRRAPCELSKTETSTRRCCVIE